MSDVATANPEIPLSRSPWPRQLAAVLALVALADWLFYGHAAGFSAVLFLLTLAAGVVAVNPVRASQREWALALVVLAAALTPLVVGMSILAVAFGVLGTAYFALTMTRAGLGAIERIRSSFMLLLDGCWQAIADIAGGVRAVTSGEATSQRIGALVVWVVPLALGAVFLLLFVSANPLIEHWLASFDFRSHASRLSFGRIGFWLLALSLTWPFIFMRDRSRLQAHMERELQVTRNNLPAAAEPGLLFGEAAILRSLLVFNAMFAVQTLLDVAYLWGGVALPSGMTYATYAHRGAYPLIITALLAAAFVVVAMKPGSKPERSPLIRALVFLWVGQNVLLVISSILRLDLYVAFYSLTYWRVAAFIWMLLVAAGLVLIVARIALGRSTRWLVRTNLGALALTLYVCCFVNLAQLIANYNVAHSWEMGGGVRLDVKYLTDLGPHAIPAIDRLIEQRSASFLSHPRHALAASHRDRMTDWRAWNVRDWQLARHLHRHPAPVPRPDAPVFWR